MYLQGMKQVYPRVEKVSASSFSSRGLFFSSIWTVQPRSDCPASAYGLGQTTVRPWLAVQILENESSLSANQFRLSDSPLLSNYFPAAWNYYSSQEFIHLIECEKSKISLSFQQLFKFPYIYWRQYCVEATYWFDQQRYKPRLF